jgi:hypothetical protein
MRLFEKNNVARSIPKRKITTFIHGPLECQSLPETSVSGQRPLKRFNGPVGLLNRSTEVFERFVFAYLQYFVKEAEQPCLYDILDI